MRSLPTGIVTFLFTDVEGNTHQSEQHGDIFYKTLARHDALADAIVAREGGVLVKPRGEGDSLFCVFARPADAVSAACALQQAFLAEVWPHGESLSVRFALHTGEADLREGDYRGVEVNRAARVRSLAHGGQIVLSQATATFVQDALPPDCGLRDLGLHRLRDLTRPEQIYQLLHPDLPAEFPPLRSLSVLPNNLPEQLTSFVGRDADMVAVRDALAATRLLTLTGAGGTGKTRLALQVAAELLDAYETDGIWLIELAPIDPTRPDLVAQAVASALKVRETGDADLTTALAGHCKSRALLLVLDNCEHLVQTCAELADGLLRACPDVHILATSRLPLDVPGETVWPVSTLALPDVKALPPLDALAQIGAVRLFVERAKAAAPAFALTAETAPHVAAICVRLDGIPFAIELVAAKLGVFAVGEIEKRLSRLLKSDLRTTDKRHKTVESLIDWSYDLLPHAAQRTLLRRLSVFAGGWTLEAAESVCAEGDIATDDVMDLLIALVRASLVVREEVSGESRYRLLEMVRQYAGEKLAKAGEEGAAQDRHVQYFLDFALQSEPYLTRREQAETLRRLEADHDNLRAALKLAVDNESRLQLAGALGRFWAMRGYFTEGRSWLSGALARSSNASPAACAKAMLELGSLAWRQGDFALAQEHLDASLAICEERKNVRGCAEALNRLGHIARDQGDYSQARVHYQHSCDLYRNLNDSWGLATTLNNLGIVTRDDSDRVLVRAYYEESLRLCEQIEDAALMASVSCNLGLLALDQKDYETAHHRFEQSLAIFRSLDNKRSIAITLHNLGEAIYKLRGHDEAAPLFVESLVAKRDLGDRAGVALTLSSLAEVARDAGNYQRAARLFSASAKVQELAGMPASAEDKKAMDREIEMARGYIDASVFTTAWLEGSQMTLEEMFQYAIEQMPLDNPSATMLAYGREFPTRLA